MVLPKFKWLKLSFGVLALVGATFVTTDYFSVFKIRELQSRIDRLTLEKQRLLDYAARIKASRRMAQVSVIDQDPAAQGGAVTVLHWQQIGPDGVLGPVEVLTLRGTQVYFEAMVAKFEYDLIGQDEAGRKTNVAMFRRAFGDEQSPATGHPLDQTAPRTKGERTIEQEAEAALWARFWELSEKPELAREFGIRIAQCEAPSVRVKPGQIWEVTLDAAGGLNLRKIAERQIEPRKTRPAPEENVWSAITPAAPVDR